ncbi:interleukin-8-like [Spea bombifrons]|uniref:interleukin-8-like n=1 Tax=Spea bombifrons TaxID=233779 RepID=UPI00234BF65E|nr:interleukin-8-like [Spea bombifrons]
MSVKQIALVSLLGLLVILQSVGGFSLEPKQNGKCKCLKKTADLIHPRTYEKIEIFLPNRKCPNVEFLITLKNGSTVCVDTEALWVQQLIKALNRKKQEYRKVAVTESNQTRFH